MGQAARVPESSDFWKGAQQVFEQLQEAGAALAVSKTVEPEVEVALKALVDALPADPELLGGADPYLVSALYASTTKCLQALREPDPEAQRRELRIPFERARQALRGLLADEPVMDDRSPRELVRWLLDQEEIPRSDLARVLEVSTATLRRWADPSVTASPKGDEARRLRVLAKVVNQLRWSFSAVGVIQWLERPHPSLKGEAPQVLLRDADPEGGPKLLRLAKGTRSMSVT
jgi:uncharacterized protein (DUF2384 family)